ncbi:uncharacterized protein LOC101856271 [Aplysia californica]|uniref:Uncharacterized protein LOC101856271 n=1 Tax=Aplysia californica TaxID=6500 RepID=A0ABM0JSP6_APLCA|nr:uncharacterized protein LOC101856271 [Aplysia californica]
MAASPEVAQNLSSSPGPPPPSPTPDWGGDSVALKDFPSKRQVPGFAKVVKGNYMTLGSSKFSLSKQHHEVFVHSVKVGVKVLAHCLKRVEATSVTRRGNHNIYTTTRLYAVEQRLAVPISYQGWFELLSEDGKSARPISSVIELSKVKPEKCLVRENIKAYIISDESKPTFDKTKIVIAGEQLLLNGELSIPSGMENKKVKLLRCIDTNGDFVYLSFDQKGMFTPIAGEKDFTGVFNIRDIIRRFRLPLTVKLIQGVRPKVDPSRFTGLIRLDWVYSDETAFVCPIEKNHVRLLPVPTDANLQLVSATNQQAMKSTELYNTMMTKCSRMITNYNNTLHLIVQVPDAAAKGRSRAPNANVFSVPFPRDKAPAQSARSKTREHRLMDEIDNLYGYVRDGGAPPENVKFSYDSDEESYWEEPAYEPLDEFRARLKALEAGEKVIYHAKYQPQDPSKIISDLDMASRRTNDSVYGVMTGDAAKNPQNSGRQREQSQQSRKAVPPPLPPRPPDLVPSPVGSSVNAKGETSIDNNSAAPKDVALTVTPPTPVTVAAPTPVTTDPPPIPPRRYSQPENGVTTVSNFGLVSSSQSSQVRMSTAISAPSQQQRGGAKLLSQPSKSSADAHKKRERLSQSRSKSSHESNSNSGGSSNGHRKHLAKDFKDSDISSFTRGGSSGNSSGGPTSQVRKKMQTLYL